MSHRNADPTLTESRFRFPVPQDADAAKLRCVRALADSSQRRRSRGRLRCEVAAQRHALCFRRITSPSPASAATKSGRVAGSGVVATVTVRWVASIAAPEEPPAPGISKVPEQKPTSKQSRSKAVRIEPGRPGAKKASERKVWLVSPMKSWSMRSVSKLLEGG